ncbi:hypothetical protein J6590_013143 [Homalodisca vitripennis]|nr:hypothetical protein J6590_013143 [Homalodisca vitripennis]
MLKLIRRRELKLHVVSHLKTARLFTGKIQDSEERGSCKFSSDPSQCKNKSRSKYSTDYQQTFITRRLRNKRMTVPLPKRSLKQQLLIQLKLETKERWFQRTSSNPDASKRNDDGMETSHA